MELLSVSVTLSKCQSFSFPKTRTTQIHELPVNIRLPNKINHSNLSSSSCKWSITRVAVKTCPFLNPSTTQNRYWMVVMDTPPQGLNSKPQVIDYYVNILQTVLGSEKDAQMCIYDASWDTHFGFCCDIDEEISPQLASLPGVLLVRPDPDFNSSRKDYSLSRGQAIHSSGLQTITNMLFPTGNSKHWLVRIHKPGVEVVTKAQIVDYYAQILTKVMGNEKDAQMCIYHVSWKTNFGFCCELDEDCAQELAGVSGVLSVQPDNNFESENKDYGGSNLESSWNMSKSSESQEAPLKTKKLFVTGLSFYTSEKTLRAAFEGFGELVEVKVIMDKISKRSKGYAFVEYTTEEAASAALKEMNGKIINGWMIVVDFAKPNPPRYNRNALTKEKRSLLLPALLYEFSSLDGWFKGDECNAYFIQVGLGGRCYVFGLHAAIIRHSACTQKEKLTFEPHNPKLRAKPTLFSSERLLGSNINMKGRNFELEPFGAGRRICSLYWDVGFPDQLL
ncbi:unnamed protein product [Sphenostylis stenocarpa]|uniref:RRM domain-containing protein n=1 Tax=Sphenostylis stenocarpa TaxID=92480 RepID=A0AA87B6X7_9FABA|nr:unnamed protein product [Sphenostylis stenocarpa]